ncbi:hypothetical protein N879_13450 [Alcaligenes sp. EGD-AK7]|nr:hypothetical protein N879_13450 [Alcaligenes sp. EGD-AK7]
MAMPCPVYMWSSLSGPNKKELKAKGKRQKAKGKRQKSIGCPALFNSQDQE